MNWSDLLAALALVLILEGLLPFAGPQSLKKTFVLILQMDDRTLRTLGLASIIIGLLLLYFVRG
jgi:uncharacterized protein YjeT (DUF2065 family)